MPELSGVILSESIVSVYITASTCTIPATIPLFHSIMTVNMLITICTMVKRHEFVIDVNKLEAARQATGWFRVLRVRRRGAREGGTGRNPLLGPLRGSQPNHSECSNAM